MADDDGEVPFAVIIRFLTDFTHRVRAEVDVPALTGRLGKSSVPTRQPAIDFDFWTPCPTEPSPLSSQTWRAVHGYGRKRGSRCWRR